MRRRRRRRRRPPPAPPCLARRTGTASGTFAKTPRSAPRPGRGCRRCECPPFPPPCPGRGERESRRAFELRLRHLKGPGGGPAVAPRARPAVSPPPHLSPPADEVGRRDELDGIAQRGAAGNAGEERERLVRHLHVLLLASDAKDAGEVLARVLGGVDNERPVEQAVGEKGAVGMRRPKTPAGRRPASTTATDGRVPPPPQKKNVLDGNAVGALVVGAANARDAAVGRHNQHGRHGALQRTIEKGKALHIEHVHLVNEEHARHNLGLALLAPLGHLGVDLFAHLRLDLARVACRVGL